MNLAAVAPLRVFVVENDEDTLKYFRMYLEDCGHQVWVARSVREALGSIPVSTCEVLISDVSLADGTGWDLLRRLQEEGLAHPAFAIAMSGLGMNADRLRSAAVGFRHHLLKPFDLDELDEVLAEAAAQRSV